MKTQKQTTVCGVIALGPRPTVLAAALVATAVTLPVAVIVALVELL